MKTKKNNTTILFVDDDTTVLSTMRRMFADRYTVKTAASASDAYKLIRTCSDITVIISDYSMPHINGLEFFERVIEVDPLPSRIMLTGKGDMNTAVDAVNRGCVFRFLIKPCEHEVLRTAIEEGKQNYEQRKAMINASRYDALTSLLNRRTLMETLDTEIRRSKRYGNPLSIAMMDVDHFKSVNDTFGHPAGDQVLSAIAGIISENIRDIDAAGRYGGEEFIIVMPESTRQQAVILSERLRKNVADYDMELDGRIVTVSTGIAQYCPNESIENFISRADKYLYQAKQMGRNKTCSS